MRNILGFTALCSASFLSLSFCPSFPLPFWFPKRPKTLNRREVSAMKIRFAAKLLLIPVCCLLFSGCIKIVNLQDRAIVQGEMCIRDSVGRLPAHRQRRDGFFCFLRKASRDSVPRRRYSGALPAKLPGEGRTYFVLWQITGNDWIILE